MASIGKFAFSLANGVQETTVALANLNLDFAVVRLEAPAEFRGLGDALSKKRKIEAEEGSVHATARRLGALFADDMPDIPELTRAYGLRASEIASDNSVNPTGQITDGPLAGHIGADGTSIWAAATSGRGALHMHLLACLLARMWSASEATAIWSEFVSARKAILRERLNGTEFQTSLLTASLIDVTRDRLAEWDASARSWLRTADRAKLKQHKQHMLIVDNVGLPVRSHPELYESVMDVWINAMTVVEKLVAGVAQSMNDPSVLMGLSAWHIYPDMVFTGHETINVTQSDPLVRRGGLVTIGMQTTDLPNNRGISWTMPLAQLEYYGKANIVKKTIGEQSIRVSFDGVIQVAMGSIISSWGDAAHNIDDVCRFFKAVKDSLERSVPGRVTSWYGSHEIFGEQATAYLQAKTQEKKYMQRLITLGRRQFSTFMAPEPNLPPAYGLCSIETLFSFIGLEEQIRIVREIASKYDIGRDLQGGVISYQHQLCAEYATIFPQTLSNGAKIHCRWITPLTTTTNAISEDTMPLVHFLDVPAIDTWPLDDTLAFDSEATVERAIDIMNSTGELCGFLLESTVRQYKEGGPRRGSYQAKIRWHERTGRLNWKYLETVALDYHHCGTMRLDQILSAFQVAERIKQNEHISFHPLNATPGLAIYQPEGCSNATNLQVPLDYLTQHIDAGRLDEKLASYLRLYRVKNLEEPSYRPSFEEDQSHRRLSSQSHALIALHKASKIYESLSNADVDLSVAQSPLSSAKWARIEGQAGSVVSRPDILACIAMFETGHVDLDPDDFRDVIAISSGNKLYVSELLLSDPCTPFADTGVRCLIGNIGRPGMALLLSPTNPLLLEPTLDTWAMANHVDFDDKTENNFASTSLHVSLTGYHQVVNITANHGRRDKEVFYSEAVVSAHENGKWVGDIDVLGLHRKRDKIFSSYLSGTVDAIRKTKGHRNTILPDTCSHTQKQREDRSSLGVCTSIDCWAEFLDVPPNPAVIRAKGNWIARLALAAAMWSRNDSAVIVSSDLCWSCILKRANELGIKLAELLILC